MKYERIERTLEETLDFCDKLGWVLGKSERDLINGTISSSKYLSFFGTGNDDRSKQFVDFFFKQVEEFEEGQWCWFYDNGNLSGGTLARYNYYLDKNNSYICKEMMHDCKVIWDNCISIKEFRKRLKEYL